MNPEKLGMRLEGNHQYFLNSTEQASSSEKEKSIQNQETPSEVEEKIIETTPFTIDKKNTLELEAKKRHLEVQQALPRNETSSERPTKKTKADTTQSSALAETEDILSKSLNPEPYYEAMKKCFGQATANKSIPKIKQLIAQQKVKTERDLANVIFNMVANKFALNKPVTGEEITKMHAALFEEPLKEFSEHFSSLKQIPEKPHAAYLVKSLSDCFQALSAYKTCEDASQAARDYLDKKPEPASYHRGLPGFLRDCPPSEIPEQLKKIKQMNEEIGNLFEQAYEKYQKEIIDYQEGLKQFPLLSTHALGSTNVNETYILQAKGEKLFIFKPCIQDNFSQDPTMGSREQAASGINLNGMFPIPKTVQISFNNWQGSAQLFLQEARNISEIEQMQATVSPREMHALAIFDLISGNGDRHSGNILYKAIENSSPTQYKAYGIDHDRCFKGIGEPLKMEYLSHPAFKAPFDQNLIRLVDKTAREGYAKYMQSREMPEEALEWMNEACQILEKAIKENKNSLGIIKQLMEKWNQKLERQDEGFDHY
ncbi:hypothetical protein DB42_EA00310 [Neochlamydia sp. EPS4]|uniref:hypothetical protein n=1 Tax=Neochlamydia sp. EPS4 TaxID=1478175 RepID=UPI0005833F74|nr:hypothetical protein [Neochlamydia sp. EPS4]KIC76159.1 hypothetical protein DB42_EA00310 [Neochlamydia sp. EPS4]